VIVKKIKLYLPFIFVSVVIVVLSIAAGLRLGDWQEAFTSPTRLLHWDGKIIIDNIAVFLAPRLYLFLIGQFCFTFLFLYSVSKFFHRQEDALFNVIVAFSFLLFFPFSLLFLSAGVFGTSIAYLWPMCFLAYGFTINVNKRQIWSSVIKIFSILLGTAQEQYIFVSLCVFGGLFILKLYREKKIIWQYGGALIATLVSFVFVALGDSSRYGSELYQFPDFKTLSVFNKLDIGFIGTFSQLFMNPMLILIAVNILILLIAIRNKRPIIVVFSGFLTIVTLFPEDAPGRSLVDDIMSSWTPKLPSGLFTNDRGMAPYGDIVTKTSLNNIQSMLPDLFLATLFVVFVICLLSALSESEGKLLVLFALFIGILSRMLLSFSPTVWVSGFRTFTPFIMILFYIYLFLLLEFIYSFSNAGLSFQGNKRGHLF